MFNTSIQDIVWVCIGNYKINGFLSDTVLSSVPRFGIENEWFVWFFPMHKEHRIMTSYLP